MSKDENQRNKLYEWLKNNEEDLQVNVYNTTNHDVIFQLWPGRGNIYTENEKQMKMRVKNKQEENN